MQKKCIQLIVLKITSLDYNGANSYLFVNGTEIYQFQDSVYGFSVDYAITFDDKELYNRKCWGLLKNIFYSNVIFQLQCTKTCFN